MNEFLDFLRVLGFAAAIVASAFACYWVIARFSEYDQRREATNQQILRNLAALTRTTSEPALTTGAASASDYGHGTPMQPQPDYVQINQFEVARKWREADVRRIVREELDARKEK